MKFRCLVKWQKLILDVKVCSKYFFIKILGKYIFRWKSKKKSETYFFRKKNQKYFWKKNGKKKVGRAKKKKLGSTKKLKFYFQILNFENFEIFEILRFWKNIIRFWDLKKYFQISDLKKKSRFWDFDKKSDFQILWFLKISDFIIFSKRWFVINTHSILTNEICMNSYIIRRILSTCQNIHAVIIKEIIED